MNIRYHVLLKLQFNLRNDRFMYVLVSAVISGTLFWTVTSRYQYFVINKSLHFNPFVETTGDGAMHMRSIMQKVFPFQDSTIQDG